MKKVLLSLILLMCAHAMYASPSGCDSMVTGFLSSRQENKLWSALVQDSHFSALTNTASRATCERTADPEALATPQPLLSDGKPQTKIIVNFIIGTDGHVHSPLILKSTDDARDSMVLATIRSWKFRPATCNGVPAEADGTVEFSRR